MSTQHRITRALSRLSHLACALEDYQDLMESGLGDDALLSRATAAENIEAIRDELRTIERTVGIEACGPVEIHAVPDRPSDDWPDAA